MQLKFVQKSLHRKLIGLSKLDVLELSSSQDHHPVHQALVPFGVVVQHAAILQLPDPLLVQLLHVAVDVLVLLDKLEEEIQFRLKRLKCRLTSAYCFVIELIRKPPFLHSLAIVCRLRRMIMMIMMTLLVE